MDANCSDLGHIFSLWASVCSVIRGMGWVMERMDIYFVCVCVCVTKMGILTLEGPRKKHHSLECWENIHSGYFTTYELL